MANLKTAIVSTLKHWYLPLIVGILFIVLGCYIFTVPLDAYVTLAYLFSISFIIAGLAEIYFAYGNKDILDGWGWYLTSGILTLLLGIYLVMNPSISAIVLPYVVGFAMLFRSFQGLGFALDLKKLGLSWGTPAFISVLAILFSFLLIAQPLFTGLSLVVMTALAIIVVGIFSISLSLTLKKIKDLPAKLS
jgi:uncharacterized membrane protein HdeD (DUF308 family)